MSAGASGGGLHYRPPGPVADAFMNCDARLALIMGPQGSGKTVASAMRGIVATHRQPPEGDGVRRVLGVIMRRTYVDLWRYTIPSWTAWFPRTLGKWTGGVGSPAQHDLVLRHPRDGGRVELSVAFMAPGDLPVSEAFKGLEATWIYLDEADGFEAGAMGYLFARTGRYRLNHHVAPAHRAVWGSCNAFGIDHPLYADFVAQRIQGRAFFHQPGGRTPRAENLAVLPPGFYDDMAAQLRSERERRRLVDAEFLPSLNNTVVYPELDSRLHVSPVPLKIHRLPLILSMDAGGTPAAIVWQRLPTGQWRALDELATPADEITGPNRFGDMLAQRLAERFRGLSGTGWADPSAAYGADKKAGEKDWIEAVSAKIGMRIRGAPTNAESPRIEALRLPMTRLIDGAPGLLIDGVHCPHFVTALAGGYAYKTRQGEREAHPNKNHHSHIAEAGQYGPLGGGEYDAVRARQANLAGRRAAIVAPHAFNP